MVHFYTESVVCFSCRIVGVQSTEQSVDIIARAFDPDINIL